MAEHTPEPWRGTLLQGGTAGPLMLSLAGFLMGMLFVFLVSVDMLSSGLGWVLMGFALAIFLLGATWGFWRARPTFA